MPRLNPFMATRNAMLDAVRSQIDAGGAPGSLTIYAGQKMLGVLGLSYPCADKATGAVLNFGPISRVDEAATDGKANRAVIADSTGTPVLECDVGKSGVIQLNTTDIKMGGPIEIRSFTLAMPGE
jgi:hypothetical protein